VEDFHGSPYILVGNMQMRDQTDEIWTKGQKIYTLTSG
jgi:hypothetical protein